MTDLDPDVAAQARRYVTEVGDSPANPETHSYIVGLLAALDRLTARLENETHIHIEESARANTEKGRADQLAARLQEAERENVRWSEDAEVLVARAEATERERDEARAQISRDLQEQICVCSELVQLREAAEAREAALREALTKAGNALAPIHAGPNATGSYLAEAKITIAEALATPEDAPISRAFALGEDASKKGDVT